MDERSSLRGHTGPMLVARAVLRHGWCAPMGARALTAARPCAGAGASAPASRGAPAAPARARAASSSPSAWHVAAVPVDVAPRAGETPCLASDVIVNVTFVNYAGERTSLPGRVGDSLYTLAQRYKYEFLDAGCGGGGSPQDELHAEGAWFEPKYGEGAQCYFCHVIVPKSHYHLLPPKRPDETQQLQQYPFPEDMTDTSRLACQVVLTKGMDGMVVYIPDGPPSDLP